MFFVSGPWEYQYKNRTKERKVLRKNNSVSKAFRGHNKGRKAVWIKAGIVPVFFSYIKISLAIMYGSFDWSILWQSVAM